MCELKYSQLHQKANIDLSQARALAAVQAVAGPFECQQTLNVLGSRRGIPRLCRHPREQLREPAPSPSRRQNRLLSARRCWLRSFLGCRQVPRGRIHRRQLSVMVPISLSFSLSFLFVGSVHGHSFGGFSIWRTWRSAFCVCLLCLYVSVLTGWINFFSLPDGLDGLAI
jgi:hypothetical protein